MDGYEIREFPMKIDTFYESTSRVINVPINVVRTAEHQIRGSYSFRIKDAHSFHSLQASGTWKSALDSLN